jgi:parafibromin
LAVGFVSVTERKSVVDWLEGKITDHERIVPLVGESSCTRRTFAKLTVYLQQNQLPPGTPPRSSSSALPSTPHKSNLAEPASSPSKRRYVADVQDIDVMKKIN